MWSVALIDRTRFCMKTNCADRAMKSADGQPAHCVFYESKLAMRNLRVQDDAPSPSLSLETFEIWSARICPSETESKSTADVLAPSFGEAMSHNWV